MNQRSITPELKLNTPAKNNQLNWSHLCNLYTHINVLPMYREPLLKIKAPNKHKKLTAKINKHNISTKNESERLVGEKKVVPLADIFLYYCHCDLCGLKAADHRSTSSVSGKVAGIKLVAVKVESSCSLVLKCHSKIEAESGGQRGKGVLGMTGKCRTLSDIRMAPCPCFDLKSGSMEEEIIL